jgi:hypothetical protein
MINIHLKFNLTQTSTKLETEGVILFYSSFIIKLEIGINNFIIASREYSINFCVK